MHEASLVSHVGWTELHILSAALRRSNHILLVQPSNKHRQRFSHCIAFGHQDASLGERAFVIDLDMRYGANGTMSTRLMLRGIVGSSCGSV